MEWVEPLVDPLRSIFAVPPRQEEFGGESVRLSFLWVAGSERVVIIDARPVIQDPVSEFVGDGKSLSGRRVVAVYKNVRPAEIVSQEPGNSRREVINCDWNIEVVLDEANHVLKGTDS